MICACQSVPRDTGGEELHGREKTDPTSATPMSPEDDSSVAVCIQKAFYRLLIISRRQEGLWGAGLHQYSQRIFQTSFRWAVSEFAFGLDYLSSEGVQAGSNGDNNIEIFITDQDMLKIAPDFGPLRNSNTRYESGQIDDSLWILFNKLCAKTFSEATYILHQDHRS
ncbi:hypothetical protein D9758_004128 [Tetrapyrgos nigripes]|uniref:Uncharacterized protein n=1 Tax=Tetrapyrgos nigripes TaxID=182062 RepID=A0A8H5GU48_9AGAR|nr:hypothetical protein D9758_004128 [Tetrapyrgos nigripes]